MRKTVLGVLIAVVIAFLTAGVVSALPSNRGIDKAKSVSPAIEDGNIVAPPDFVTPFPTQLPESELTKIIFIRYAPGFQANKPCDYDGICDPDEKWQFCSDCPKPGEEEPTPTPTPEPSACYAFLSGAKPRWNWVEDYYYSNNLGGVSGWATSTWDAATSAIIFGSGISGSGDWGVYDYKNSVLYGDYPEEGVIAVTAIWFRAKNIYEYDIMFDTDYFPGSEVDLDTVALHEFGHGAGLDDLYDVACDGEVMYGYYTGVKTILGPGDTAGIQTLYGN